MKTINIKGIIERQGLDVKEISRQLFPKNKYPRLALNRVMSGGAVLDANQISKFALLAGIDISDLYSGANWNAKSKQGVHIFTNGDFRAELNADTWITKIFHKDSLFHESIIHSGSTPLSAYLNELDSIIINFKNHEASKD
jgi:hypothetical protein